MNEIKNRAIPHSTSRRRAVTGIAVALSGLIAGSEVVCLGSFEFGFPISWPELNES